MVTNRKRKCSRINGLDGYCLPKLMIVLSTRGRHPTKSFLNKTAFLCDQDYLYLFSLVVSYCQNEKTIDE
jgi:hypothetical protein